MSREVAGRISPRGVSANLQQHLLVMVVVGIQNVLPCLRGEEACSKLEGGLCYPMGKLRLVPLLAWDYANTHLINPM